MGNTKSTITSFDIGALLGRWWEIASIPNGFSHGCEKISVIYTYNTARRTIDVIHECYASSGQPGVWEDRPSKLQRGAIWQPDPEEPGKLMIQFEGGGPGSSVPEPFWIIYIDPYNQHALIGSDDDNFLWVLSRCPQISEQEYKCLLEIAVDSGYNTQKLFTYPSSIYA